MQIKILNLTTALFAPYGQIIEMNETSNDSFQIIVKEEEPVGWRIALSRLTRNKISMLGLHPNSRESFEPIFGVSILLVAHINTPDNLEAFLLDKPVCIYSNIWHATAALSEISCLQITENLDVDYHEHLLPNSLEFGVFS